MVNLNKHIYINISDTYIYTQKIYLSGNILSLYKAFMWTFVVAVSDIFCGKNNLLPIWTIRWTQNDPTITTISLKVRHHKLSPLNWNSLENSSPLLEKTTIQRLELFYLTQIDSKTSMMALKIGCLKQSHSKQACRKTHTGSPLVYQLSLT